MADFIVDLENIPTEILFNIFQFLPAKDLLRYRRVCIRWKHIIDKIISDDQLWSDYCQNDFAPEFYETARKKTVREFTWFNLYRSLMLWPKLSTAAMEQKELQMTEVRSIEVLENGMIAVLKKGAIEFFDIDTLRLSKRGPIKGEYIKYQENNLLIVLHNFHNELFVIHKARELMFFKDHHPHVYDTKMFLLKEKELIIIDFANRILHCDIQKDRLSEKHLNQTAFQNDIVLLGDSDIGLNILTINRDVYTLVDNKYILRRSVLTPVNWLDNIYRFNFLDTPLDILLRLLEMREFDRPPGPAADIIIMKEYGDVFFVGFDFGVLCIYHKPFNSNGDLDIFKKSPLKTLDFTYCQIVQVDAVEIESGHKVFVAFDDKVVILKFTHGFSLVQSEEVPAVPGPVQESPEMVEAQ